ncbi:SMR domain-containing protein At5g58720 [Prosopis cineraria]|uniref:SMR domain-containing protein At5g58720 n=1 Tax=Prosopis cineraria TaxID=364024 RepID=UPI00240EDF64|nr:SMR domain-containing protein At5g58720 [Prosopis cineraria]XP_054817928.1 SMR domain-containing protein At5g58720 [Prosopis cineraria]XP_054817929.1 SMR domain-containing protein At5g58720 [Prosopis cineraria]
MKNTRKKKKRSPAPKSTCKGVVGNRDLGKVGGGGVEPEGEQKREVLERLVGAFSLSSSEEAALPYKDAEVDLEETAQIPMGGFVDNIKVSSTCSSSSGFSGMDLASTSGSSEGFMESNYADMSSANGFRRGKQKKKVSAAMGTVSTVLGKEYMRRSSNRPNGYHNNEVVEKAEVEQFLCSMLGNDCDISLAVVRDVLCQCGYKMDKALDVLLEMSMPSDQQYEKDRHPDGTADNIDDMRFPAYHENLTDSRSECTSFSSEGEFSDNWWSLGSFHGNYAEVLSSSKAQYDNGFGNVKSELPQKVLESLFDIHKSTEHDKDAMNWSNVVKKMQSLAPQLNASCGVAKSQQHTYAKGDDYYVLREDAKQHWDSMRSYYQKASAAHTKKERAYAAYLSDQGKEQSNLAQKADAKASHDIFMARNKDIENVITIDLHGQHVKPAMRILKLHLLFGSVVPSVRTLRVITGCGSHGVGKSKLKQSVIKLLEKENVEWREENRGTVIIKLSGSREFSFLDSDTDSDCN